MKPSILAQTLVQFIKNQESILILGQPGSGKTAITEQVATSLIWDDGKPYDFLTMHPVVSEPPDIGGYAFKIDDKRAGKLPVGDMYLLVTAERPTVVLIDDIGQASPVIQASLMQVLWARSVGEQHISDFVTFIGASNRKEDNAKVSGLIEPIKSRFSSIVTLNVHVPDWITWAINAGMPIPLIAYVGQFRPDVFDNWKPTNDLSNTASPRTMAAAGRIMLKMNIPIEAQEEVLSGAIGRNVAIDMIAFMKTFKKMPILDHIIMSPATADIPKDDPAVMYAVMAGLARKSTDKNFDAVVTYLDRVGKTHEEYTAVCVKAASDRDQSLKYHGAYTKWCATHSHLLS